MYDDFHIEKNNFSLQGLWKNISAFQGLMSAWNEHCIIFLNYKFLLKVN